MKAAILQEPKKFVVEERDKPEIAPHQVMVQIKVCGICTSELDMWEGKAKGLEFPRFIGHEVAGVVTEVGADVTSVASGDHVAVWSEGKGYAEYVAADEEYLFKLKKSTPLEHALGEPIACAVNGVRKTNLQLNDSVCIVGCGFMGLMMLQLFKLQGAGLLIAVDRRPDILALARRLGATHIFNPQEDDVKNEIKELTDGKGVDLGVEGAGIQQTLDLTTDLVRMEGKLEVFGFHQGEPRKVNWGYWNWMAFSIINGHVRSANIYVEGMHIGLKLLEAQKLQMQDLVTHRFPLEKINDGFALAASKQEGFVKGVVMT